MQQQVTKNTLMDYGTLMKKIQYLITQQYQLSIQGFSITATAVWNSLSSVTKSSATITTFKAHLITELFSTAFDTV